MKKKYIILLSGAFAYFNINVNGDKTATTLKGSANGYSSPTMKIITSNLYLNLDANLMSESNAGKTYFANTDSSGKALVDNPNYLLAIITGVDKNASFDCTYNYKITASVGKSITDGSDSDIKVVIGDEELTLKEILDAGSNGIIISDKVKKINAGDSISLNLSSSVTNTQNKQDNLIDNSYVINIEPYNNGDTKSFDCKLHKEPTTFAEELIDSDELWESGLTGDGYRYTGTGNICKYNNGTYQTYGEMECKTLYNIRRTTNSSGKITDTTYETGIPTSNASFTYEVTATFEPESTDSSGVPNNFVCFGTTDKDTCLNNKDKYLFRIIGVFKDSNGENHVKLIKFVQLAYTKWNDEDFDGTWGESTLFSSLNGSTYLDNTSYIESSWKSKIADWTWTSVNTLLYKSNGVSYYYTTPKGVYEHEMLKASSSGVLCANSSDTDGTVDRCKIGEWSNATGKIGLMYASDYALSLGDTALNMTGGTYTNGATLRTGWLHPLNNDRSKAVFEWTLAVTGTNGSYHLIWEVDKDGYLYAYYMDFSAAIRPVFYLTSDILPSTDGVGSYTDPYILS